MDALARDLRYAGRMLVREPGFTLLALLALALGIGATTAIFTVVDAVLLRPLPYASADRLVVVLHGPEASGPVSPADFGDYRGNARSLERLSAAQAWSATIGGGERPDGDAKTCVRPWIRALELGRDAGHLGLSLVHADAVLQSPEQPKRSAGPIVPARRERQRHPQLGTGLPERGEAKPRWHDPNDDVRLPVELDGAADD